MSNTYNLAISRQLYNSLIESGLLPESCGVLPGCVVQRVTMNGSSQVQESYNLAALPSESDLIGL